MKKINNFLIKYNKSFLELVTLDESIIVKLIRLKKIIEKIKIKIKRLLL